MENMKRDPGRFLAREEPPTSSQQDTDAGIKRIKQEPAIDDLNDLKLSLLQCGDVESLGSMVKAGLSGAVPGYGGALFYQDVDIAEIFTADSSGVHVCSPKPDCISNVFTSSQPVYADVSNIPQCVLQHLPNNSSSTASKVGCLPVCKDGQVLSVFVVFGNDFNESTTVRLHTVIQQIAACYNHIQRSFQSTRNVEERVSQQLIKLCGELYDQDAAQLQLKVLRYLEEQTQAECAFLYLVVPETQELFCQVIGKKILQEEERFPGLTSVFSSTLETKQPMGLEDIPMEGRKALEEKIGCPLRSFLCVPVTSRIDDNLIALSCLANKHHATRFTERDISCIRQCFRYTSTVLTSTLAFQNERKLKTQTQALLQVARDLFTNLGKLNQKYCSSIDNFPVIESRGCWTNVCAHGLFCSRSYLNMFTEQITNKYLNGNWLSLLIDEYVAKPAEKCEPGAGNGFVSVDQLNDRVWKGVDDSSGKDRTDTDQPALCLMSDIDDKAASDIEKNVLQNEEKTITVAKNFDLTIYNDTVITEEKLNEYRKKLNQSVGNQAEKVRTGIETINANGEELKRVTQTTVDNVSEKLSCSICASDSPLLFESANSEWERNSDSSLNTAEDAYLDSSVYLIADAKNLLVYRPDILGFSDVKTDQPNQSESEPICALEVYPIYVDSRAELNEAFHTECMDDTVHYITNDSVEDMPGCNDSIDTGMFGSDKVIDSSVVEEKNHEEHLNGAARNYQNCSEGVIECSRKAEEVFVNDANIRMMQVPPIFNMNDLTKLLREIMQQARNLTHAERCSVFLIDHDTDELVAKVFDGITPNKDNEVQEEIRMPITQGIAGKVATSDYVRQATLFFGAKRNPIMHDPCDQNVTGELLNIKDAYSHPLFYRGIDVSTGFRTRSILCFPIKDETGRMLGVAQLCNKQNCPCFTTFDEEIATAFGIYCCISISHSLMYKKVIDSQVRNSLANELMMYHMKSLMYKKLLDLQHRKSLANELMIYHMQVSPEDVHGLSKVDIPHPRFLNSDFVQFSYAPRCLSEDRTLLACLSMFEDLNLISRWKIRRETLARFVLMVKKGYRNPPYHNWMHAYTVAQFCYQLIKNLKLENSLDDIEMFSLFISCLCHDIDHRGTNNSFQTASRSVLAALYSSEESVLEKSVLAALYSSEGSVLERHHFAQTMCILNTEGCNVFENLNSKDYQHVLDLMRDIILATDVAHHFKILKNLREMADRGYEKVSKKDRKLLLCLLMTSCDLSDQTRPWDNTKRVAALIYKEFFSQGDMEKAKGLEPIDMMDRERAQIPALQIGFLDHVALPVYRLLGKMFPECVEIGERVEDNKQHWDKISGLIKLKRGGSQARMTFEEVLAIENEDDDGHSEIMNGTG